MVFSKSFHGEFTVHLIIGQIMGDDVSGIFEKTKNPLPTQEELEFIDGAMGVVKSLSSCEALVWFPRKLGVRNCGTVAHEVFHLWHLWNQRMCRDFSLCDSPLESMEVDAYFFSDVVDWIYDCSKELKTKKE